MIIMQIGLKKLEEDEVYRLGVEDAQHQDFNVMGVMIMVSFVAGVIIGVMI